MINLTFGEQVKIILSRKRMTIKELAELVEQYTGKSMSRQNMTQRLGRDNFQEKDMRMIAEILGCKFQLSIMEMDPDAKPVKKVERPKQEVQKTEVQKPEVQKGKEEELDSLEREVTIGELLEMSEEDPTEVVQTAEKQTEEKQIEEIQPEINAVQAAKPDSAQQESERAKESAEESEERKMLRKGVKGYFKKPASVSAPTKMEEKTEQLGDINPYTGKEYQSNSVRMHPKRIGYVQVYDQQQHKWTDMTEWAFLGYQERKKRLLGKDYEPPIYLD